MAETLTRDEVHQIVNAEGFDRDGLTQLLKSEFDVDIPEDLEADALVDFVFKTYQDAAAKVTGEAGEAAEKKKKEKKARKAKKTSQPLVDLEGLPIEVPDMSRAQFIANCIQEGGTLGLSSKDVISKLDVAYGYTRRGRNCRTRVAKTVKALIEGEKIAKLENGNLAWLGTPE